MVSVSPCIVSPAGDWSVPDAGEGAGASGVCGSRHSGGHHRLGGLCH